MIRPSWIHILPPQVILAEAAGAAVAEEAVAGAGLAIYRAVAEVAVEAVAEAVAEVAEVGVAKVEVAEVEVAEVEVAVLLLHHPHHRHSRLSCPNRSPYCYSQSVFCAF
jgi:hypothetical protein